ncbi:MAG: glycosyltransferase family 4 protein [Candidatus Dormibacteria bacterium]
MRIAADGSWLRWRMTGLGRYMSGLLHGIEALRGDRELFVYYNSGEGQPLFSAGACERFIRMPNRTLWNQVRLPLALRRDRPDVYLGAATVIPWAPGTPAVAVIHDCLAFRIPQAKPGAEGRYWRHWTTLAARRAARVVTDSQSTARDIEHFTGVPLARIAVIPPGVDPQFFAPVPARARAAARQLLAEHGVTGKFILQVAAGDHHKGMRVAAAAVGLVAGAHEPLRLVATGASSLGDATTRQGAAWVGAVADDVLRALYESCAVVCVASEHEGFGLPVLEAMAMSRPVVSTTAGALPEAGGELPFYCTPGDVAGMASALDRALSTQSDELRGRLAAGRARAQAFTWTVSATSLLGILDEAGRS